MNNLYVKNVPGKGRGVFAPFDIKKGDCVEIAPTLIFHKTSISERTSTNQSTKQDGRNIVKTIIQKTIISKPFPDIISNVIFNWSDLVGDGEENFCIILGLGSIFNSANPSNLRFEGNIQTGDTYFYAVQDIPAHTELTINYSGEKGSHISEGNYWFEGKDFVE